MREDKNYYIVDKTVLPEIFLKVMEVKNLLESKKEKTVQDAVNKVGISRSAFYKYRDSVQSFQKMNVSRVITLQFLLHDEPGVLSNLLTTVARQNVNILTINSITPTNGCAIVTITAETTQTTVTLDELMRFLSQTPGVIKSEVLAG